MTTAGPAPTIRNLQALRAVAALMVVAHHLFAYPLRTIPGWPPIEIGAAGVDVFFVISGIVMALTTARGAADPLAFFARRAARIVPLYWLFTTAVFVLLLVGFEPLGVHDWTARQVLGSYLFLPNADGPPILNVGWTLEFEMFFYLAVAAALVIRPPTARTAVLVGGMAALAAIGLGAGIAQGHPSSAVELIANSLLLEFAAGFALGAGYLRWRERPATERLAVPLGAAAVALGLAGFALAATADAVPPEWRVVMFGLPALALCAGALSLERGGVAATSPGLLFLGDASYALYLVHPLVIQTIEKVSTRLLPQSPAIVLLVLAAAVPIVVAAAAAVHVWIERPLQRSSRTLLGKVRWSPAGPVAAGQPRSVART